MKRLAVALIGLLFFTLWMFAANVLTDGDMETTTITSWPLTNVTGTNASAKATDQKDTGTRSLKGTSQTGKAVSVEWYNAQTDGVINTGDTVLLSLWWGVQYTTAINGANGTMYADLVRSGGTATRVWSQTITPGLTFQSGRITSQDISSFVTTSGTYSLRIGFIGKTANTNGSGILTWYDNVVLDVTAGIPPVTTVGDGTDPSDATICSGPREVDAFTLQTNVGTDAITNATITLASGTATALSLVEITSNDGATVYGSASNPATTTVSIPVTITATTALTPYKVRITPKAQPALTGTSSYNVTATVTALTSPDPKTYGDTGSATITIDNTPAANATWGTNTAGDGIVTLAWTPPGDADYASVLVLRSTTTPITAVPVEGQTYSQGNTIGSATVRYAGTEAAFPDTAVTNGTTYSYKIFAKDACGNYASGVESPALRPQATPQTTTVGNGSEPGAASTCPGGATKLAGVFTLQTTAGTDALSDVTVTLSGGATALSKIEIVNDGETAIAGSVTNPSSNAVTIPLSLTATTTLTQYRIRVTPKTHAAMPAGDYAISGTVTAITSSNLKTLDDTAGSTVSIDNSAPSDAVWGTNRTGNTKVDLAWSGAAEVFILRNTAAISDMPADGTTYAIDATIGTSIVRYAGSASAFSDTEVVNDTTYYYKVFAKDACGNYAPGVPSAALTPTIVEPKVVAGTGSATVDSCNQITVRVPHSGDVPSNSTTKVEYATAVGGPWTVSCATLSGVSPRTCIVGSLTPSTTYYFRVTFTDADGVTGQNPQLVGPWTTPATCSQAATTAGTATAIVSSCKQITVSAPLTGDGDRDGYVRVERNTTNTWPGTVACATVSGASPRQCLVTELDASTAYYVRVEYVDPDGGATTQVLGPLTTAACGADTAAPMVIVLAPARAATVGGTERAKLQVWDTGALAATNPVVAGIDGGALSLVAAKNNNYNCGTGCGVYEFPVDTSALANGEHTLRVQATDAAGNVARTDHPLVVNNRPGGAPRGTGTLLRRTHSSQLCIDCHAVGSHSSQSTRSTKYGNWGYDCLTCHTPHQTPNVKLVRPTLTTPNSGPMSVTLRTIDKDGGTNPQNSLIGVFDASGAPFNDGICESCHTKTTHYRNDASGGDHTHYQGQRCTGCHNHVRGFKATGCIDCHFSPPAIGKHRVKHDEAWDSSSATLSPASYADASSHATATQYGFACNKCHAGTHENDKNNPAHDGTQLKPWAVEVAFQGLNAGGTYSATYNANTDAGIDGSYYSWSNGTCASSYCHSNAAPVGGTNAPVNVTWNQATPTTCTSCHKTAGFGDAATDATFLSRSHAKHIQSASGETGTYNFECDECHAATIRDNPSSPWALATADLKDKRLHVNEEKNVAFSTTLLATSIDQSAATYDDGTRGCGGTYCHSPGTKTSNFDPPNVVLTWGQTATCHSCHGGNAGSAAPITTGKHANHISNASLLGVTFTCETCHNATVTGDTTINSFANHVNGVPNVAGTNAGTYTRPNCTSSRCHSSGQRLVTPQYYSVNWSTDALDCKGCHGRHSDNAFVSVAGEPNYTTAGASSKYNSHRAHVALATDCKDCHAATVGTSLKIDGTTPSRHLDFDGTPDVVFATKYAGATYNASTRVCSVSCHGSGTPAWGGASMVCLDCHGATNDRDDWVIDNDVASLISTTEWTTNGHGTAAIALPGTNPCLYCHTTAAGHKLATNPFRLANTAGADGENGVCLICHETGSTGYNSGSGLKNGTKKINSYHYATKHSTSANGGRRCWDCHDPHGDTNIRMIGRLLIKTSADNWGLSATRTSPTVFTTNATGAGYVSTGTGITATGVCNVCHTTAGHYTATSGDSHSSAVCTTCHAHSQAAATDAFKNAGGGGNCLGCHGTGSGAPGRRAVNSDFSKNSHHVGNGGSMGGTLSNFDCVVCHAEGKVSAGTTDTAGQPHMDGKIDLRNVDNATAYFTYDKSVITGTAASWNSGNANWRTQTSTQLDPFCLTCHDSNGATAIASLGETGASATNPFKDTTITNNYDQVSRGSVVDIKSKVSGAPPAQGTFSRHAIRGQSTSRYTKFTGLGGSYQSMYQFGGFNATMPAENGNTWNDTSVMGCADCHTTDGANGTNGNAHGSNSEYLLKDAAGLATEGTLTGQNYICYRCHALGKYNTGTTHAPNGSDYQDTTAQVGSLRIATGKGGSIFGNACMNCHGGANGFGWIHGTNQTFGTGANGTGTARNAYRFTNGASLRYYQPATNWEGAGSCFTLASADSWGGCTQHNRSGATGHTAPLRPINY